MSARLGPSARGPVIPTAGRAVPEAFDADACDPCRAEVAVALPFPVSACANPAQYRHIPPAIADPTNIDPAQSRNFTR
ncbi:hypothetical protein ORI20_24600 [Mycobacterium sp. CVI_P3]|uniref:Uncharacterized protein n=1 Tax=Mycobacterium pinniadriaticum TaxID=2994102 RepID=A0ABT3SK49_9MYCO|nr:hypothetical protein [Mycobacterium pinniadriaticum]MCX2933457.1 hypothetical protein [Mycobacterium pinniadriaticum]MCX2939904.1 hypothetical protein [Mycobacterium pinniadriaticum]